MSSAFIFSLPAISFFAFFQSAEHLPRRDCSPMYLCITWSIFSLFCSLTSIPASFSNVPNHFQQVNSKHSSTRKVAVFGVICFSLLRFVFYSMLSKQFLGLAKVYTYHCDFNLRRWILGGGLGVHYHRKSSTWRADICGWGVKGRLDLHFRTSDYPSFGAGGQWVASVGELLHCLAGEPG